VLRGRCVVWFYCCQKHKFNLCACGVGISMDFQRLIQMHLPSDINIVTRSDTEAKNRLANRKPLTSEYNQSPANFCENL
jgi:hypothetical protein